MAIVVLDTETTGPPGMEKASIIELGAVVLNDDGEELGSFGCFVRPLYPVGHWCRHAMRVNQIDPRHLIDAPAAEEVWPVFVNWMSMHKPIKKVLAFNVTFDRAVLEKSFPESKELPWGACLMRDANHVLFGNRKAIKLDTAARAFGVPVVYTEGRHRALFDARLAGEVYNRMVKHEDFYRVKYRSV